MSRGTTAPSGYDPAAARRAAAELPSALPAGATSAGESRGERIFGLVMGFGAFAVVTVGTFVWVATLPWGWLLILAGLPAWLVVRWLFSRMRGSESGMVAVDDRGVIHVITGHAAVRRLVRLYDVGTGHWIGGAVANGLLMVVLILGVPVTLAVTLDAPSIMLVWMTAMCFAILDFTQHFLRAQRRVHTHGYRRLDGNAMMPALALYARHHGWRAAVSGVPADRLAATIAAHPEDKTIARNYAAAVAVLAKLALASTGSPGGAGSAGDAGMFR